MLGIEKSADTTAVEVWVAIPSSMALGVTRAIEDGLGCNTILDGSVRVTRAIENGYNPVY